MRFAGGLLLRNRGRIFRRLDPGDAFDGARYSSKHPAEIGNVDQRQDQTDDPEKVLMGEQR